LIDRFTLAALVLILVTAIFLGPSFARDGVLNIGYQPSTHQIAEMVAMEKGWWQQDLKPFGITEVREFGYPSGPPEMQAMLAGDLDIAYVGTAPVITAINNGLDAKIVAAVNSQGSDLVLRPGIKYLGPKSLIGLSIATFPAGSVQDIVLRKWLKDNGVDVEKLNITSMGPGDAITAMYDNKVNGAFLPEPSPAIIERENIGSVVIKSGEMWPNHACCCVVVSGNLIRENPELIKQVIKTHMKATDYINAHPDEAAEIYANKTGQDLDYIVQSISNWDGKWISDPNLQVSSTIEYAKISRDLNYTSRELDKGNLFDTDFYNSTAGRYRKIGKS
jgi:NitT/TauT family transport system substrate-binding protein